MLLGFTRPHVTRIARYGHDGRSRGAGQSSGAHHAFRSPGR